MYMLKNIILMIFLLINTDSFTIHPNIYQRKILRENYIKKSENFSSSSSSNILIPKLNNRARNIILLNDYLPSSPETQFHPTIVDNILDITIRDKYLGKIIVEEISELLPKVDSIGHNILHANNEFINYILNDTNLSEMIKKNIVLGSIKLAILGDNMGSVLLQLYYDIVDKCL